MSPTRRDTLKAAGAASGLAMLGGHAVAQQDETEGDGDGPGAQTLEEGQGAVRVGHFVSGAPAVNVRVVPAEGSDTSGSEDDEVGGSGTDETDGDETSTETETETETETDGNETGGNTSDDNTTEDLQTGNETNESDTGNETDDEETTDDGEETTDDATSDGEGELIAENVSFGDVSEYTNVDAGDYTVQILAAEGETDDADTGTDSEDGMGDDDETGGVGGNETDDNATGGNTSDDNTTEDLQTGNETNESDTGNETGGVGGNETGGVGGNETDAGDNESDDDSDDDMFSGGILDDSDDNESDDETDGMDDEETDDGEETTDDAGGEVIYEEDVTVGETFYTAAAVGASADDIQIHVIRDYDAAQVRLVHASPDAPAVDVVVPDASMTPFDDVSFGQATEYVGIPPGSYSLSVRVASDMNDGDEVDSFDVEVESGEAYSAYAVGSPADGEEEFDLVVTQDGQSAAAGLGDDEAPGEQEDAPGEGEPVGSDDEADQGNETGNETGEDTVPSDPPGEDNESGAADEPGNASGSTATGNASGDD